MKFHFAEKQACWVSFYHTIDADNFEQAESRHNDGEYDAFEGHEVGDAIDYLPTELRPVDALPHRLEGTPLTEAAGYESLSVEELDLIVAALRLWQATQMGCGVPDEFVAIATEHGKRFIAEPSEIDSLCEHLNCSENSAFIKAKG